VRVVDEFLGRSLRSTRHIVMQFIPSYPEIPIMWG
jgi:hypothetical protein